MPCSDSDSEDLVYMRKVFEWIESKNDEFDLSRVYAHGFSQNSVWSSVIGVCFNEKVRGIYLGASGMSIKGISKWPLKIFFNSKLCPETKRILPHSNSKQD